MKTRTLFLSAILFLLSIYSFGQGTTLEEYNYLTKGYKIQLESGLDMKKGYYFKDVISLPLQFTGFQRVTTFKHLFREGESIPCATLMIFKRTDTNYESYVCIPHIKSDEAMWKKSFEDFATATNDWTEASRAYASGMFMMISLISSGENK